MHELHLQTRQFDGDCWACVWERSQATKPQKESEAGKAAEEEKDLSTVVSPPALERIARFSESPDSVSLRQSASHSGDATLYLSHASVCVMSQSAAATEIAKWLAVNPDSNRIDSDITTWKGLMIRCDGMCRRGVRVVSNTKRGREAMGKHVISEHAGMRSQVQTVFVNRQGDVVVVCDDLYNYGGAK